MLDELSIQITKPQVWIGLALTAVFAYAIYRFGRLLIKALTPHIHRRLAPVLKWAWLLTVSVSWLAVATFVAYLPSVPVLFELGRDITQGFRHSAGQLVVVIAMALIAWNLISTLAARIVAEQEFNRRSVRVQTLKGVVESTLRVVVVIIGAIAALQAIGLNATSLLAGVSVLGLAVGFGAQSLIKDVFNGFFILLEDQYGVGDVITINTGQLSGGVERLNLRVTALRALDGTMHIVPNGQIQTVSVSSKDWSRVVAAVDVTYNANVDEALKVLQAVSTELYESPDWRHFFLEEPEMQGVVQLAPDGVTLRALYKVQPKSQWALGREFNRRIKIAMDEAGIEIPFPQRSVNFGANPIEIRLTRDEAAAPNAAQDTSTQNRRRPPVEPSLGRDPEEEEI
ncbi:mechanosensitive ion channel protein MscS [Deinococcus indicus]|jgi:moderate conductance mechanosensitive channel|uniref:Mechanosensitive ion channel protein MscS n=1 Tax=Deinococcus indicus TaxID=223556 RepID=A0A246BNX5_9DEIO|nr:mechanosensitive ion channel family protein [Deinococcus indicus]OWL97344.1 mechanosensitive ion channel protein MscS [Deinococcus indicus]GHG31924.1 mechanosensitive ion channel protein MscS [Deinococcus indicus]